MENLNLDYYNSIMNSLDDGIIVISKEYSLIFANKKALKTLQINNYKSDINIFNILPQLKENLEVLRIQNNDCIENFVITISNFIFNCDLIKLFVEDVFSGYVLILKDRKKLIKTINKLATPYAVYTFDNIIGESNSLGEVINAAKLISKSPSTVLITGESGCGKELLAQAIHNDSLRKNNQFIAVNCGALPKSLVESELFGYEEGAFTGASRGGKAGKFELANGGTIFLDEIGEMPLEMQVNLLRVIQEGSIIRVGGKQPIKIDVRIIAATNKDLKEEIKKGRFRSDLYYRLNVMPLHMPPLKERFGDIPILIDYFLKIKSEKLNKPIPKISANLFKKMISYCWPGNIRELENCVENIVNLNGETSYEMNFHECTCLKYDNLGNKIEKVCDDDKCEICNDKNINKLKIVSLLELEKEAINNALDYLDNNMTKVAESLGISRNALYNKMKRYGISKK